MRIWFQEADCYYVMDDIGKGYEMDTLNMLELHNKLLRKWAEYGWNNTNSFVLKEYVDGDSESF